MEHPSPDTPSYEELRERFREHGQEHVFRFWPGLDPADRQRLLAQAGSIELASVMGAFRAHQARHEEALPELAPVEVEATPEHGGDPARFERARALGEELLRTGRVAAMVVAGGQATRLGFDGPKGAFPIGPVTERSLFEIQAQKLRNLRRRHGRPIPWYVMTSQATDAPTREFFARHDHFGLPPEDVCFFRQAMVPSIDFEGRLMLESPARVFENPNGHGGSLTALLDSGALDDMERRGTDTIFYYQVDNPLVRVCDPAYLGFHAEADAEMSCKVVRKQEPGEKVGVLARVGERVGVVEYTELSDEHRHARGPDGELLYWAGNAAMHVFSTAFVRRIAKDADSLLPYHASAKKIPTVDAEGRSVAPGEPNGLKLERFVFDALPAARRVRVVEMDRESEYSPVKNAEGSDSPVTARRALVARYRTWLAAAGIAIPDSAGAIEIDHSRVDGRDDARALGIQQAEEAPDVIRIGAGIQA